MISKYNCQVLLRHYWKQGLKATEAVRIINAVKGENPMSNRTAQIWFKRFFEGDTNLLRKKGSGRPSIMNSAALLETVKNNPTTSTRKLAVHQNLQYAGIYFERKGKQMLSRNTHELSEKNT